MPNPFVHVELHTRDLDKSKSFYSSMFDWKLRDAEGMDYTMVNVGEGTGGGMMKMPDGGGQDQWLSFVLVEDINASTEKAKSLGAEIRVPVGEVMGMGWYSVIVDPTGAALGLWQPKAGM